MGFFAIFLLLVFPNLIYSAPIASPSISPNFTASNFQFIDVSGAFLVSLNNLFTASITNSNSHTSLYYFLIIHVQSNSIIWSANPNKPVSTSSLLTLSPTGLSLSDDSGLLVWSTPPLSSPIASMLLLDSGNLLLLDHSNASLWESFHFPTDTIVVGQRLTVMNPLFPAQPDDHDISSGGSQYRLLLTSNDLLLQWNRITFWKLSMELKAFTHSYAPVSYLAMNASGLYLFSRDGSTVVMHVSLNLNSGSSDFFRFGRFEFDGRFKIMSFVNGGFVEEFVGPSEICQTPTICGKLKLCFTGTCSCPPSFTGDSRGGCVPADSSLFLASSCGNISTLDSNSSFSYLRLMDGVDYFANNFMEPVTHGVDLQFCKDLCSKNCSCLGLFYEDSSSSCFLIWNQIGSIISANKGRVGFIKTIRITPISEGRSRKRIPLVGLILIPSSAFFLVITFAVLLVWFRRWRMSVMLQRSNSSSSAELEMSSIPGLPIRYSYNEIATATNNFKTQIGSGGFGIVYKGTLPDKTIVAVKKITGFGVQGRRNFCAEIGVIGNIHHVNLVRLNGFCLQGRHRLLVLEYMNRGSLDEALFGDGDDPVLEWKDRFQITLGTARGLAYLHSGCDHKIIHCDVKPENILLNDSLGVKISDFGLSKLLTPEQSGLLTTLRGTRGYLAPEWLTSSTISDKTDVYSFGMVVLEIVRGRKNWLLQEEERVYFPLLALQMHMKGRYVELVDPRLKGKVRSDEVEMLVRVGLCCVHEDPALRPTMANVVGMLEGGIPMADPIVESLSFLHLYGRRFNEATMVGNLSLQDPFALQTTSASATSSTSTRHGHPRNREKNNNDVISTRSCISSQQVSGPR